MSLVLLCNEEPHELCIRHLALPLSGASCHGTGEYAVDHPRGDGCRNNTTIIFKIYLQVLLDL